MITVQYDLRFLIFKLYTLFVFYLPFRTFFLFLAFSDFAAIIFKTAQANVQTRLI